MNRARVAALLRELADAIEEDDDVRRDERRARSFATAILAHHEANDAALVSPMSVEAEHARAGIRYWAVYFVQPAGGGLVKIGSTGSLLMRVGVLQRHAPVPLVLRAWQRFDKEMDARAEERALHARFAGQRRHGEWFDPAADLLALIRKIRFGADAR